MLPFTESPCTREANSVEQPSSKMQDRASRRPWILVTVLVVLLILAAGWITYLLYAQRQGTVTLSAEEQTALDLKLQQVGMAAGLGGASAQAPNRESQADAEGALIPEAYEEDPARRQIRFSERELNAAIARDPALAGRAAVRLSPGQVSASFLVDVPEELPLLGGRSLRIRTGVQLLTRDGRIEARLLGVSIGGVPVPDAWLGGFKGSDLLATSGLGQLGAGIEALEVVEGELALRLAP